MKKELLILLTAIFLISTINALIQPAKEIQSNTAETKEMMVGYPYYLCTEEMNPGGVEYFYFNGNKLTEEGGNCNAMVRMYKGSGGDQNLFMNPYSFFNAGNNINPYAPYLTFPPAWRFGTYVESQFNWDFQTDYCFTEKYTSRHKTGIIDGDPANGNGEDFSHVSAMFLNGSTGQYFGTYEHHIPVENINRPVSAITADNTNYVLHNGDQNIPMTLTITDPDLSCGNAEWMVLIHSPLWDRPNYSAETFEVRIDGQPVNLTGIESPGDYTGPVGSFGITLTETNTGEISFDWTPEGYEPGEYDINITVFDTDGYFTSSAPSHLGLFYAENYSSQFETTVHVTIEAPPAICGDPNGDRQINVGDAVYLISYIFRDGPAPQCYPLTSCADPTGDGQINVGDAVYLINYIFKSGPAPDCNVSA